MPDQPEQPKRRSIAEPGDRAEPDAFYARDLALIDELETEAKAKWLAAGPADAKEWTITLSRLTYWRRSVERASQRAKDAMPMRSPAPDSEAAAMPAPAVSRGAAQAARLRSLAGEPEPD